MRNFKLLQRCLISTIVFAVVIAGPQAAGARGAETAGGALMSPPGVSRSPLEAQVVTKYAGGVHQSVGDKVNGLLFPDLCQQEGTAELDLFDDGTLILTAALNNTHIYETETSATCTVEGVSVPWKFRGTYAASSNSLAISSICLPDKNGQEVCDAADLRGNGTYSATSAQGQIDWDFFGTYHFEFDLQAVGSAGTPAISAEYIYNTYGIRVEDSFGDDQYAETAWTDHELSLLNDVLKVLPPGLIGKMAVTRIVRNKMAFDSNGDPKPTARGVYTACNKAIDPDCTGSSATIRIFDPAHTEDQFANDPDGDRQFKGSILHELTHALQATKDKNAVYWNLKASSGGYAASPVVQNWMDATRNVTDMNNPQYFSDNNGWALVNGGWKLSTPQGNKPPTGYGATLPTEDMADSVKMYVYDPQKLQNSSPQRYNYLRNYIFDGVEYEDGMPKQP